MYSISIAFGVATRTYRLQHKRVLGIILLLRIEENLGWRLLYFLYMYCESLVLSLRLLFCVPADMFAWPIVACDDQDIGQFLPAIANVVDIICPMPYLDHLHLYYIPESMFGI